MQALWVAAGIIVLGCTLLDVFLAALNYDESGFIAGPLATLQWRVLRSATRRMSRRVRPMALRQVTGLQIMLTVGVWLGGTILGFAFIYYGLMSGASFSFDGRRLGAGPFSALYLSAAQLATVGTSQVTPNTDVLRVLTIAETLIGLILVTLILTFLLGVYQVIRDLRALSSTLFNPSPGIDDPLAGLAPYFPGGRPTGLDTHLQAIHDTFDSYTDGVRLHHSAYYFQSGRDQFSVAYSLHMLSAVIGGLRWGLPAGHPAAVEPVLIPLSYEFERFRHYLHARLKWKSLNVPEVLPFTDFAVAVDGGDGQRADRWVATFLNLNQHMAQLARLEGPVDTQEAYQRYRRWLPFAYTAGQMTTAVSRDLDYQPVTRPEAREGMDNLGMEPPGRPPDSPPDRQPVEPTGAGARSAWHALINRWIEVPDPGLTRLRSALRAVLAAGATVLTLLLAFSSDGPGAVSAAIFGALIAMQTTVAGKDDSLGARKVTTVLCVLPALAGAALGAAVGPSFALTTALLVLMALVGVGIGRFGPRWAALGQLAFVVFYFSLLLHVPTGVFYRFAIAIVLSVLWSYLFNFVIVPERPAQVLEGGVGALGERLVQAIDPLVDAVAGARWDPDISGRVRSSQRNVHRAVAFVGGHLTAGYLPADLPRERQAELRLRLFDTELAANNLAAAARHVTGADIPLAARAGLAGQLELGQGEVRGVWNDDAASPSAGNFPSCPPQWPDAAHRLRGALLELLRTVSALRKAQGLDTPTSEVSVNTGTDWGTPDPGLTEVAGANELNKGSMPGTTAGQAALDPTSRHAIQSALATGVALLAGSWVSATYEYWAALPAYQLVGTTDGETVLKGVRKVAGTVLGAAIGFAVAIYSGSDPVAVLSGVLICLFATVYFAPVSSPLMSFWQTAMFALLYEILGKLSAQAIEIRVLETIIGAAIAVAAALLVLPARTGRKVTDEMIGFLRTLAAITSSALQQLAGGSDGRQQVSYQALQHMALRLGRELSKLISTAAPLRRSPGALGPDGVERRLAAFESLSYHARHLVMAAQPGAGSAPLIPLSDAASYSAVIAGNTSLLISLLGKQVPDRVLDSEELPQKIQPDGSSALGAATIAQRELQRINEALLLLAEDLTPDLPEAESSDEEAVSQ